MLAQLTGENRCGYAAVGQLRFTAVAVCIKGQRRAVHPRPAEPAPGADLWIGSCHSMMSNM